MAAWQADFNVILKSSQLPGEYRDAIQAILPRGQSWTAYLETWGTEDGDRIDVLTEPDSDPEVQARFDLRRWNPALYESFLALVRLLGAELERAEDGREVTPSLESFQEALRESRAARFVRDPEAYFEELRKHPIREEGP